jgi:hypothetical protein
MARVPQPPSLESKSPRFGIKDPKESWHAIYKNRFFREEFSKKMVKQITSPKNALNYHSNQILFRESMAR